MKVEGTKWQRRSTSRLKKAAISSREHVRNWKIATRLVLFLVLVAAFAGGFLVRANVDLMTSLGIPVDESEASVKTPGASKTSTVYDSIAMRVLEVEDMLSAYSFDDIHLDEATTPVLSDLATSTNDPYATYFTPERYEKYMEENADRKFSGVGVLFGDYDGRAYAIDVLEGSEAQAEGVQQGDFVHAIDGDSGHVWSASEVIGALARGDGENIVITWTRPMSMDATGGDEFTTTLTCRNYDIVNVTTELDEGVGYIKLRQVTGNASELVAQAIADLSTQGALAFVLDVTDNPGGFLTQALDVASQFVPSGVLVGIKTPEGTSTRTATGVTDTTSPLVVMANEYTSGVAEVLVAALKDNQRATVVGQTTMGKGSVQVMRELTFGGAMRYTCAYYLTPLGRDINGVGVSPSIEVSNPPDSEDDMQKTVALVTARSMIAQ